MTAVITVVLVGIAGLATVSLAWIIPSSNTSIFRYRLWNLRDRVYDDIRAGAFDNDERPSEFLAFVERAIIHSPEFTPVRLLITHLTCGRELRRAVPMPAFLQLDQLSTADRGRMTGYLDEFERAATRQIIVGTPSGWVATAFLLPVAVAASLWDVLKGRESSVINGTKLKLRDELRDEIVVPPSLGGASSRVALHNSI